MRPRGASSCAHNLSCVPKGVQRWCHPDATEGGTSLWIDARFRTGPMRAAPALVTVSGRAHRTGTPAPHSGCPCRLVLIGAGLITPAADPRTKNIQVVDTTVLENISPSPARVHTHVRSRGALHPLPDPLAVALGELAEAPLCCFPRLLLVHHCYEDLDVKIVTPFHVVVMSRVGNGCGRLARRDTGLRSDRSNQMEHRVRRSSTSRHRRGSRPGSRADSFQL